MLYQKPTLSIQEQITKLKNKGLEISDEQLATQHLQKISYYRFRAYTYPFQDNNQPNQPFITPITFEQLVALYQFDSQLRTLIFDALEKIEIALRTQIVYQLAMSYGSHWHSNSSLFRNLIYFNKDISKLQKEINRSDERFIKHYKNKYTTPSKPPCWMSFEVSSFGLLSSFFENLNTRTEKKQITNFFGLKNAVV